MNNRDVSCDALIKLYDTMFGLYGELETISGEIYSAIASGAKVIAFSDKLTQNMGIADRIKEESLAITAMKKELLESNNLSEVDRSRIADAEKKLTDAVDRVVSAGGKNSDLIKKQGVKISRS